MVGECNQGGSRSRSTNPSTGHEHRTIRLSQQLEGTDQVGVGCGRAKGWNRSELLLAVDLHVRFGSVDLAFVAGELNVNRAGRSGGGGAKRLTDQIRNPLDTLDGDVHLGYRFEGRDVVDFLIDLAKLGLRVSAPGESDDRRVGEIGVAQSGCQVQSAHHLGCAHAGLS